MCFMLMCTIEEESELTARTTKTDRYTNDAELKLNLSEVNAQGSSIFVLKGRCTI